MSNGRKLTRGGGDPREGSLRKRGTVGKVSITSESPTPVAPVTPRQAEARLVAGTGLRDECQERVSRGGETGRAES